MKQPHHLHHAYPAAFSVAVLVGLQLGLPQRFSLGAPWLLPMLELGLLGLLLLAQPRQNTPENRQRRVVIVALLAVVNAANVYNLAQLVHLLISGSKTSGEDLLLDALKMWLTNVIVFALWYFELDGGGPVARQHKKNQRDFLFTNMSSPQFAPANWKPHFVDYLFVSVTNASAFSPTDTLPLTIAAKLLMMFQAVISLLTVALVAARAVNILN